MESFNFKNKKGGSGIAFFGSSILITLFWSISFLSVSASAGVPKLVSHQGQLLDSSSNLLGGSGTNYCFRFSLYDNKTVGAGSKLWPTGTPSKMTVSVKNGIYSVDIGDTNAGGDLLDYNFQDSDSTFLNVEVATSTAGSCTSVTSFENLSPRKRLASAPYAINSGTVGGFSAAQSASSSQVVALTDGNLILGGINPQFNATGTNSLTIQGGGGTGDINFYSSSNKITSAGALSIASLTTSGAVSVTGLATFGGGASTTLLSVNRTFYAGGTATTTIDSTGLITSPNILLTGSSTLRDFTGLNATTTSLRVTGAATSTFSGGISATGLSSSGGLTLSAGAILSSSVSTSTFANGVNLTSGCFAISNSCLVSASGNASFTTLTVSGLSTLSNASTTLLSISNALFVNGNATTTSNGNISTQGSLTVNSTATSTFVGGVATAGLSSSGGLTLTGGSIISSGTGTSTLAGGLSASHLQSTDGLTMNGSLLNTSASTSTFSGGINLSGGCFSISNSCILGSQWTASGSSIYFNTGNVGVGSSSPTSRLAIGNLATDSAQPLFTVASSTATATTTLFTILNNGSVGVGTSSPLAGSALDVYGDMRLSRTGAFIYGDTVNPYLKLSQTGGAVLGYGSGTLVSSGATTILLNTSSITRLKIDGSGNVGIGTTTSNARLNISATSTATNIPLLNIEAATTTGAATSTVFTILSNGNVGIATTTPGSLFAIDGFANFTNATSTFYSSGGINLSSGCFAISSICLVSSSGDASFTTLTVSGLSTLANASTTLLSISNALFVNGNATTTSNGNISTQGSLTVNSTATSTFVGGVATAGLSSTGGLTLTGGSIISSGTGTSTLAGGLAASHLQSTDGLTMNGSLLNTSASTSTFSGGISANVLSATNGLISANGLSVTSGVVTLPAASIADAALSANVALLSGTQTFSGAKTFSANTIFTNTTTHIGLASFSLASSSAFTATSTIFIGNGTATTTLKGDNATSTFAGGIVSTNAGGISSTNGLTISGGSINTSGIITSTATASSTFSGGISATGLSSSGGLTLSAGAILSSSVSTSTFANGVNLTGGCFAISTSCLVSASGNASFTTLTVSGLSTLSNASSTLLSISNALFVNGNATTTSNGNISTQGTLTVTGLTTLANLLATNATTTNLSASGTFTVGGNATTSPNGNISTQGSLTVNSTATSTFVGGVATAGLSSSGGLTLTGGSIISSGTGTSTLAGGLSASHLQSTDGLTMNGSLLNTGTGTSTFANGINLSGGCFSILNTCLSVGSGTVTSITAGNQLSGGTITNSGTVALNSAITLFSASTTLLSATSTIYVGSSATTTIVGNNGTSTFAGGVSVTGGGLASSAGLTLTGGTIVSTGTGTSSFTGGLSSAGLTITGRILAGNGATAAPTYSFGSDTTTGFYRNGSGIIEAASNGVRSLLISSGQIYVTSGSASLPGLSDVSTQTTGLFWDTGAVELGFSVQGAEVGRFRPTALVLGSSQSLGIGTSTPGTKLSVNGAGVIAGQLTVQSFVSTSTTATSTFAAGLSASHLQSTDGLTMNGSLLNTGTGTSTFANGINLSGGCFSISNSCVGSGSGSGTVSSGLQGQLAFYNTAGTTVSGTTTLFLSQAGNFGIGTTTPVYSLDVATTTRTANFIAQNITLSQSYGSIISAVVGSSTGYTNFSGGIGTGGADSVGNAFKNALRITNTGNLVNIGSIQGGETLLTSGGTFGARVALTTGTGPRTNAVGDLNGDGKADIVTADNGSNQASVFFNLGNGTFASRTVLTTGTTPIGIAIGDLNGDGKADVVTADSNSAQASVFFNLGNGTFTSRAVLTTGDTPSNVAIGDVNGDGKADIVTADSGQAEASVFLNLGNGTFTSRAVLTTGTTPRDVAISDLNGDGKADVVTADALSAEVSVFLNLGNGIFATRAAITTGAGPTGIAVGDLNGDGMGDIVVTNQSIAQSSVYLNLGNGTFTTGATLTTGNSPKNVAIGDVNGDGKADIVTADSGASEASVFLNLGNAVFASRAALTTGAGPWGVSIADFNSDGKADIATADGSAAQVSVFLNRPSTLFYANVSSGNVAVGTSTGTTTPNALFSKFTIWGANQSASARAFTVVDSASTTLLTVTNAGNVGIGTTTPGTKLSINGAGVIAGVLTTQSFVATSTTATSTFGAGVSVAGGGLASSAGLTLTGGTILSSGTGTSTFSGGLSTSHLQSTDGLTMNGSLLNTGTGTSTFANGINLSGGCFSISNSCIGSGSGSVTSGLQGQLAFYNTDGTTVSGTTTLFLSQAGNFGIGTTTPVYSLDVATTTRTANFIAQNITLSQSYGSIISAVVGSSTGYTNFSGGIGTGGADSVGNAFNNALRITNTGNLVNIGSIQGGETLLTSGGTFAARVALNTGSVPEGVAIGDLNGDGKADVVIASLSAGANVFFNLGNGLFGSTTLTTGSNPQHVAIGDLNGDGKADIVTADSASSQASVFLNLGNSTFASRVALTTGSTPRSVAIGDLNGDGKADIVTADGGATSASVFLNLGNGTFASRVALTTGSTPFGVAIGDLNGDGRADIVTADSGTTQASVFLNLGNGIFASRATLTTGTTPHDVAIGDLTGDGIADIVTADNGSNQLSLFINLGNGTFGSRVALSTGLGPDGVAIGDLNGDGRADIATADVTGAQSSVFLGLGNGAFASRTTLTTGAGAFDVAIGDLNGDGKADIVTADASVSQASIFLNQPSTLFYANVSSGNVAVGTSTGTTTPNALFSKFTIWGANQSASARAFTVVDSASTTLLTVTNAGNVGIGTTSPYAKLSVVGEVVASFFTGTTTNATSTFGGPLTIGGSNSTTTIAGFLDVNGTGTNATSTFASNLWVKGTLRIGTGSAFLTNNTLAFNGASSITTTTGDLTLNADATNNILLNTTSTGNVGVGTSTPFGRFSIKGAAGASSPVFAVSTTTSGGVERSAFVIDANGRIGIGTTTPHASAALAIDKSTGGGLGLPDYTTTERDAISAPIRGLMIYNNSNQTVEVFSGTNWTPVTATSGPSFHVTRTGGSAQSITAGSNTTIDFATAGEDLDTNANFDASTDRFTPTVAGQYIFTACVTYSASQDAESINVLIIKNGVTAVASQQAQASSVATPTACTSGVAIANGSTDFFVAQANLANGAASRNVSTATDTHFSGSMVGGPGTNGSGGFIDRGTVVTLTTNSDQVAIGTTTPNANTGLTIWGQGSTFATKALEITNFASTSLLTVNNAGQVTIGTSTPSATGLTIFGKGTGSNRLVEIANSASTTLMTVLESGTVLFNFGNNLGNVGIGATSTPGARLSIAGQSNGTLPIFLVSTSSNSATSTAFIIDSQGRIAIGTSSPSVNTGLTIWGQGSTSATKALEITNFASTTLLTVDNSGQFIFNFANNTGNVGVGATSTPAARFSIAGQANATASLFLVSTSTSAATSTAFLVDSRGNVGIASSSLGVANALAVGGNIYVTGASAGNGTSTFQRGLIVNGDLYLGLSSGANLTTNVTSKQWNVPGLTDVGGPGNRVCYNTGASGRVSFNATCDVSDSRLKHDILHIGSTLDALRHLQPATFELNSASGTRAGFVAQETLDFVPEAVFLNPDGFYGYDSNAILSYTVRALQEVASSTQFISNSWTSTTSPVMFVDGSGNIGFGTSTPGARLAVQGDALVSGSLNVANLNATGTISTNDLAVTGSANFVGGLVSGNGLSVTSGTITLPSASISDSALSSNVATLAGTQSFSGAKTFGDLTTLSNASTTLLSISNALFVNGNATTTSNGNISTQGTLTVTGLTTLANLLATNATTTNLSASGTFTVGGNATTSPNGNISTQGSLTVNSTATSTFVGGVATAGLSSSGGLTLTGGSIISSGTGTSTLAGGLSASHLQSTDGLTMNGSLLNTSASTSTFSGGISANVLSATNGLISSNGLSVTSGVVTLPSASIADSALSANVALLTGTQTFSGAKTFSALTTLANASTTLLSISNALFVNGNATTTSTGSISTQGIITAKGTATSTFAGAIDVNLTGTNATSTFASNLWVKKQLETVNLTITGLSSTSGQSPVCINTANGAVSFSSGNSCNASDSRLKNSIVYTSTSTLATLRLLKPASYEFNSASGTSRSGFIAQDVLPLIPEAVFLNSDGYYSLDEMAILSKTVRALQEVASTTDLLANFWATSTAPLITATASGNLLFGTSSAVIIESSGNVAIGTSTNPLYKLAVGGDIAATGYVNLSTESSKKNIEHLTSEDESDILSKINTTQVATYHYRTESDSAPLRMGLIAEEAPREVLSVDGKGVDIYKLTSFAIAGIKAQQAELLGIKVDLATLTSRVDAVERSLNDAKNNIKTDKLCLGSTCVTEAQLKTLLEKNALQASPTSTNTPESTTTPLTGDLSADQGADTEAPTITLVGPSDIEVTQNSSWIDLGAAVHDNVNTNLGVQTTGADIDTTVLGTYEIQYNATDGAGNQAVTVVRTVRVVAGQ